MGYKANEYKISKRNPRDKLREDADLDFGIYVGEVIVRPKDQSHSGRIPVYIPMLSKDRNDPKGYYNAYWSSPFAGTSPSASVGDNEFRYQDTMKTYGMWMVPPDPGNFVLVIFGDGKKKNPIIIGCLFPDQMQNMVPGNPAGVTYGTDIPLPVAEKNRKSANTSHGKEVQRPLNPYITYPIVKQGLINDPVRGTTTSGARRESPSQVFGILTPGPETVNFDTDKLDGTHRKGGHSFVLDDNEEQRHIRLRTAGGAQLLLDDTNEIVYVINSPGTAWVELAKDGSIHLFSDENINMRSTSNINIRADHTLNLDGGVRVNINAGLLEDPGGTVDTLKLGAPKGGDVFIQAGDTINSLVNGMIKMQSREGSITSSAKNIIANYAEGSIKNKSLGSIISDAQSDTYIKSGGTTNVVSGGQSFIKGSTVHLNDGGSTQSGEVPEAIVPLTVSVFKDEPMSIPVFVYDHDATAPRDPLPTKGYRRSNPTLGPDIFDPEQNYTDSRGDIIDVATTTTMITTREPWFGHLLKDTRLPSNKSYTQERFDRDRGNRYPPDTSDTGYAGPDSVVNPDGTFESGTGFDGVAGPALQDYVRDQYFDPATGGPKEVLTANQMTPDYVKMPNMNSKMMTGNDAVAEFDDKMRDVLADGISSSQFFESAETPLLGAGYYSGVTDQPTCIGYKHIIGPAEKEADAIMFGDGKNFDPTSDTLPIEFKNGKPTMTAKQLSTAVRNAGPGADLSDLGIVKANTLDPTLSSTDNAYAVDTKRFGPIFINQVSAGMSREASKALLKNDLSQHAQHVSRTIRQPMSLGQITALTLLEHMIGPNNFEKHRAVSMINSGSQSKKIASVLSYADPDDYFWYGGKDMAVSYLYQAPDKHLKDYIPILQNSEEWHGKNHRMYMYILKDKNII